LIFKPLLLCRPIFPYISVSFTLELFYIRLCFGHCHTDFVNIRETSHQQQRYVDYVFTSNKLTDSQIPPFQILLVSRTY